MALFEWSNVYSVGNSTIDHQHQRLFGIANRFHDSYIKRHTRSQLSGIFDELIDYTHEHFAFEERMMEDNDFPGVERHKENHKKLIGLVGNYKQQFERGDDGVEDRVMNFLKLWLDVHIVGMDRQYKKFIQ